VSAFVEGLLPEGNLRWHIASQAGVQATDTVGLLERVGAEYAGAVQILPKASFRAPAMCAGSATGRSPHWSPICRPITCPSGATPQASLAGVQDKVLLVALPGVAAHAEAVRCAADVPNPAADPPQHGDRPIARVD